MFGGSGTYAYTWTTSRGPINSGCTSTTNFCAIGPMYAVGIDVEVTVSVTITQAGQSRTLTSTATGAAWCGGYYC